MAAAGLTFTAIALSAALRGRAGSDPMRAMDVDGVVFFLLTFAVVFAIRLLFWPPAPSILRATVRSLVIGILALEIPAALIALIIAWQLPPTTQNLFLPHTFSIFSILCQSATIIWLFRYRREGL